MFSRATQRRAFSTWRVKILEERWRDFFSNPSSWWDHRAGKLDPDYPDFKHRTTNEALWLNNKSNPPWVAMGLSAMAPGSVKLSLFSWNRKLAASTKNGKDKETLQLFQQMQREGMVPDRFSFVPVLNACGNLRALKLGARVHEQATQLGMDLDAHVGGSLISMYTKFGRIDEGRKVFDKMPKLDNVLWNAMIFGYVKCGQGQKALEFFKKMEHEEVEPDPITLVGLLGACGNISSLKEGRLVHLKVIQMGFADDVYVSNSLVDMYAKCGDIESASEVFSRISSRTTASWNALITGYVNCAQPSKALDIFNEMQAAEMEPDRITFLGVLRACAGTMCLAVGKSVHQLILRCGCQDDVSVANSLIDMYFKCKSVDDADRVFNSMSKPNLVSWNSMILGNVKQGRAREALRLSQLMREKGLEGDRITLMGLINACGAAEALNEGRAVHKEVSEKGWDGDVNICNRLIDMYIKCGSLGDAWKVFDRMPVRDMVSWDAMIIEMVKRGQERKALELYQRLQSEGFEPTPVTFHGILKACASAGAIQEGRDVHSQIVKAGYASDVSICNTLVDMYGKFGFMEDALKVFERMLQRNVGSWNALIEGLVRCGQGRRALEMSSRMQRDGCDPDIVSFVALLKAAASSGALAEGRRLHGQIMQSHFRNEGVVLNSVVNMYAKCGSDKEAWAALRTIPNASVVPWSAMIGGLSRSGQGKRALEMFDRMREEGVEPDRVTFLGVLKACADEGAASEVGRKIHEDIRKRGLASDVSIGSSLIHMFSGAGNMEDARRAFDELPLPDVVVWNSMIRAYVKCGQAKKALEMFREMPTDLRPDEKTYLAILSACSGIWALGDGRRVHQQIANNGYEHESVIGTSLINMYAKCGSLEEAEKVFEGMPTRDIGTWNAMMMACAKSGQGQKSLELLEQLQNEGLRPVSSTLFGVLAACTSSGLLGQGKFLHELAAQHSCEQDIHVRNSLVEMYAARGSMDDALAVNAPSSWNTLIRRYVKNGEAQKAIALFREMLNSQAETNATTCTWLLNGCANAGLLEEGRNVHEHVLQRGFDLRGYVGNGLIDMYSKCGSIDDAKMVFTAMPTQDVGAFSSMILGHLRCGQGLEAWMLAKQMLDADVEQDAFSLVACLSACASVGSLEDGKHVAEHISRRGLESDVFVATSLVDMYSKCGSLEDARRIFNRMPNHNVVTWNAMLGAYAAHGRAIECLREFERMKGDALELDSVTYLAVLSACSHKGFVDEGYLHFDQMNSLHCLHPNQDHNACIVDALCRSGRVHEAEDLVVSLDVEENKAVWMSLLAACRTYGNTEMGERVAERILRLDPANSAAHVLLSNIYAGAGKWKDRARLQLQRLNRTEKQPGLSWIEVDSVIHSFRADDKKHAQLTQIHEELGRLLSAASILGYSPERKLGVPDDEVKTSGVLHHSEKLALAFGLRSTTSDTALHVFKNLRMCGDCHIFIKYVSKLAGRLIVVRDASRFHHFENGICSCQDYW